MEPHLTSDAIDEAWLLCQAFDAFAIGHAGTTAVETLLSMLLIRWLQQRRQEESWTIAEGETYLRTLVASVIQLYRDREALPGDSGDCSRACQDASEEAHDA